VVLVDSGCEPLPVSALDAIRQRIWNQNLASVVIEVMERQAVARPARRLAGEERRLSLDEARPDGVFSALDVATSTLACRLPTWFDAAARVDHTLLANLKTVVSWLAKTGFQTSPAPANPQRWAEMLMGQILFVSYLEHRGIVGPVYRARRKVEPLHALVAEKDRTGIQTLFKRLRADFNGDFLGEDAFSPWSALNDEGFLWVDEFLRKTDLETGQGEFWNYDFSHIPVELLSGIYETFLDPTRQVQEGAYYTPRHLAVLTVGQALATSENPLDETIFDGACGSGILLTTAYRRLISLAQAQAGRPLGFAERSDLLVQHIFGADLNATACRVTAFSLYLSLLEGLEPTEILQAQEQDGIKLPSLRGRNLACGEETGDFFGQTHAFNQRKFSLIISNPPWVEPGKDEHWSSDQWAKHANLKVARRQIAGAYMLRAQDFLAEGGRVCLLLPISLFLATSNTNAAFVERAFHRYRPLRLFNFGDLQALLFPSATHACHLFVGQKRKIGHRSQSIIHIPAHESFDYLIPKADISLMLGRLSMQSADRHMLQTKRVVEDPSLLVSMMWGGANDLDI